MNYPDDFNVPTFAAGKSIAVSRAMGIGIMSGFLLIIFLCGILVWTLRSQRVEPYILSVGGINDQWQIISSGENERPKIEMTAQQVVQESLVWKFVQDWFTISNEPDTNATMWNTNCQRTDCDTSDTSIPCRLYCSSSENLFSRFKTDTLPTYEKYASSGEYWAPMPDSIIISPAGDVNTDGGTWRIQMTVMTTGMGTMHVLAYVKVAKDIKSYPKTMGYYIADFNSYRIK